MDASRDAAEEIVADFARRHPERRVVFSRNERNSGPSYSRNIAFAQARGQYVALLDADDRWFPDHLEGSVGKLESTQSDVAYSSVVMFEDETGLLLGIWGPTAEDLKDFPVYVLPIEHSFLFNGAEAFNKLVLQFIDSFKK